MPLRARARWSMVSSILRARKASVMSRLGRTCLQFGTYSSPPALLIYSPSRWLCSPLPCSAWCKGLCVVAFKQFQFGTNHKPHETERARDRETTKWVSEKKKKREDICSTAWRALKWTYSFWKEGEKENEEERKTMFCVHVYYEWVYKIMVCASVFDFTISKPPIKRHNSFIKRRQYYVN